MALQPNDLKNRAQSLMGSFGPAQLAMIGLLGVIAVFAAMTFMKWASSPSYSVLFSGLDDADMASVVDKLNADGVPNKLGSNGAAILVPADRVHEVRLDLSAAGLPSGGTVGYELLDKEGITTSEFRQRVDYQRALEGELTRTLMAVDGVQAASVHLAIPEERLFTEDRDPVRASVLLKTTGTLGDEAVQSIVHLISSSVPGLSPDGVTVADAGGRVLSSSASSAGNLTNRQLRLTKEYESQLSADADTMLAQVFGAGHTVVRVSARLNFDESQRESETFDPTSQTALREATEQETFTGAGDANSGVLGIDGLPVDTSGNGDTQYERQNSNREFGVDRVVEKSTVAPGKVERLSVAVVLDAAADPVPDPATVEKIVGAALGIDAARGDSIVVDQLEFDQSLTAAATKAEAAAKSAASQDQLLGYVRTGVGALMLLVVAFFLIKGARSRGPRESEVEGATLAQALAALQGSPGIAGALTAGGTGLPALAPALAGGGREDHVLQLIDQQPEEVAVLLRGWLGDRRG